MEILNSENSTERVQKSAPEYSYYHKVRAFFLNDPDIDVGEITEYSFTIMVHNRRKYDILTKVLNVPQQAKRLKITIDCDEVQEGVSEKDLAYLLENNMYFSQYVHIGGKDSKNGLTPLEMHYVLMKPEVVQYYDDIFNNPAGVDTKTAEEIAKELFRGSHCNITSDVR